MKRALLRGRDHTEIGRVASVSEGRVALAISRGGWRKSYAHRDPNEDVAAFACTAAATLLVVADGHGGHEAAEIAVEAVISGFGTAWTSPPLPFADWERQARTAAAHAHRSILEAAAGGSNPQARTTLAFGLVAGPESPWAWASVGDSQVFRVGDAGACERGALAGSAANFLGSPARLAEELEVRCGSEPLGDARAIVLATDGLSERGIGVADPAAAVGEVTARGGREPEGLRSLAAARDLVERALEAQRRQRGGDNVAAAVLLCGGAPKGGRTTP
jgi:serine/threonine protein phosphatase PrpC